MGIRRILWMSSLMSRISESGIDIGENELLLRIWNRELWHSMVSKIVFEIVLPSLLIG